MYCSGNGFELLSVSLVVFVCHDSRAFLILFEDKAKCLLVIISPYQKGST